MDYLPISKLNTVVFCPRRYYIESILQDTAVNYHMIEGSGLHERAQRENEGVYVWHDELGISGIVDKVSYEDGHWVITDLKKGYLGEHASDQVQLCALALSYQAVTGRAQHNGILYYHRTRRRLQVTYTAELKQAVHDAVAHMRHIAQQNSYPPVIDNVNKCRGCSVRDACQPVLSRHKQLWRWSVELS